jgi:hypothetical protein
MDDNFFVAFLLRAEKNLVTFATYTHYIGFVQKGLELRAASAMSSAGFSNALELIDRDAIPITNWSSLYGWLGRDIGTWATFSEDSMRNFVPHWFSADAKSLCRSITSHGNGPFVDVRCDPLPEEYLDYFRDITGTVDSRDGLSYVHNIYSNLLITKRPIFAEE